MAEMQWYAATDSGRFDGTAAITPRSGVVCLRAELPAGVLQNAVAALPWTMAREEKIFMNGYQTWSPAGANIVRSPISLRSTVGPRSQPRTSTGRRGRRPLQHSPQTFRHVWVSLIEKVP